MTLTERNSPRLVPLTEREYLSIRYQLINVSKNGASDCKIGIRYSGPHREEFIAEMVEKLQSEGLEVEVVNNQFHIKW